MAATVGLSTVLAAIPASAESISELNQKSKELQGKKSEVESQLNQTNEQINTIEEEQSQVTDQINRIESQINETNSKIAEKSQQIDQINAEIEGLKNEVKEIENRIQVRNELLKDRARAYQEGGGNVNYLEVLVGAKNFGDLIDRIDAVATIIEADQTIIDQHNADKKELEEKQVLIEQELKQLQTMQQELESLKATLDQQKEEQSNMMSMLEQQKSEALDVQYTLEEQQKVIEGQDAAVKKAIELEQQRQAELKKQQEAAAVQKQQQAASTKSSVSNTRSNSTTGSSSNNHTAVQVSSSNFIRPTQGYISSGFGYRVHPVTGVRKLHSGVDIAKAGTVPVVAAADGVVSYSGQMNGYGNVIIITHSINGKTYETLYAHLRTLGVGPMQTVSQGQFIGYMGNTGIGTGQHLHFEVHIGRWNSAKSNAVDPRSIVPM